VTERVVVGAHVSSSGGIFTAIERGEAIGAEAIQIFPSPPQTWRPTAHKPEAIARFRELHAGSSVGQVWIHNIYLANLATEDPAQLQKSIDSVLNALTVADAIGALGVVLHTGSHKGQGLEAVERQVCAALTQILDEAPGTAVLALENAAGHGGVIGKSFGELGRLIQAVRHERLQVCIDTCHAFAAGYDIASADGLEVAMMEFDSEIGIERLAVVHANDSKLPLGGARDRHENIGEGHIGAAGFSTILGGEEFRGKAFLLEVPGFPDEAGKANGPDEENVRRLKQVRNESTSAVEGKSPTKRGWSGDAPPSPGTRLPSGGSRRAGGLKPRPSE
ncbi:MAG: deoxyribonuclease IV, partial [Chloroflexi bacterium]|nr:deoxyribonuclease IV [Chloroflexota bacterium]